MVRRRVGPGLEAAADAIGIESRRAAHRAPRRLVASPRWRAANDVDVQTVIDALVAEATAHLDEAVDERTADRGGGRRACKADLAERITAG